MSKAISERALETAIDADLTRGHEVDQNRRNRDEQNRD